MPLILGTNSIKDTGYDVANSLRFDDGDSAYLEKNFSTTQDSRRKFTFSAWVKRGNLTTSTNIWGSSEGSGEGYNSLKFENHKLQYLSGNTSNSGTQVNLETNRLFRDVSAWYHIVLAVDTSQGTDSNRIKFYVNGSQETSFNTSTYPSQDTDLLTSTTPQQTIGMRDLRGTNAQFWDGYMCEVVFIDNQQLAPDQFGEFDSNSPTIWKPKDVSGLTFGTNGFYLDFEKDGSSTGFVDSSSNARAITVTGNVHHSFDQAKFNESSIEFDGTNDSLDIADSTDFDFGTGNFTFEFFVFKQTSGKMAIFETRSSGSNNGFNLEFSSADKFEWYDPSIASGGDLPKDPSAISLNTWTHYAVVRNGTTCTMYKNGTSVGTPKDVGSNSQVSAGTPTIGESASGANDFDGYLDEIRLSNTARYTGNFTAPTSPFTSDSNTVLLIQSKASNLIGADVSGEGNHFQSSEITSEDQSTDTCTNNGCTIINTSTASKAYTLSEGNLKVTASASNWYGVPRGSIGVSSGKWYFEVKVTDENDNFVVGYMSATNLADVGDRATNGYPKLNGFQSSGYIKRQDGSEGNISSSFQWYDGDIAQIALDMDNKKLWVGKAGSYYNSGNPASGSNETVGSSYFTSGETYLPAITFYATNDGSFNFGSPPYSESGGNSDANGYGNFNQTVPNGFYALNSKNLAEFG